MLQRAASNAYSWWWASHIRTKQSKWMEQHLIDFQEKVEAVMKLLQEDGDSFAKRANMYYKGRPELINFVEESFRAYRALAERYDHISKELQNANNTIASICPEQVPFMDEDDDDGSPRAPRKAAEAFKPSNPAPPKVPKPPKKDLKTVITSATKKYCTKKVVTKSAPKEPIKSGLSKKEALGEIDKLQKQILTLQTVKEFVKSTYDNAIQKYWDTEEEIKTLQERVSLLQDEFGEGMVIEDDVARRLMTEAALRTCQETLARLQTKQERSFNETKIENTRVKALKEKLEALMHQFHYDHVSRPAPRARKNVKQVVKNLDEDIEKMNQQKQELQLLQNQIKEQLEAGSSVSVNVTEMAEKIDELVNKVLSLETSISSQDALVTRLKAETNELQSQIVTLEDDKAGLVDEKNDLTAKLREMDEKMQDIQDLNEMVETQSTDLQTHFTEAICDLDHLSEEVPIVNPDDRDKIPDLSRRKREPSGKDVSGPEVQRQDDVPMVKPDERDTIQDLSQRKSEPSGEAVSRHGIQRQDDVPIVKPDERDKIPDLSKRSEPSGEAVSGHEVQRQDNVLIVKSDDRDKIPDLSNRESEPSGKAVSGHEVQRQDDVPIVKSDDRDKIPDLSNRESEPSGKAVSEREFQRQEEIPIVKPGERDKITDSSKGESEPSDKATSEHEVQRQDEVPIVKPGERDKIPDSTKEESEPSSKAVSEHEVQRPDALNQENVLKNDLESDKKPEVSGLVDNDVQKDNKVDAADFVDNNVQKDNKTNDIGLGKNIETNVTGLVDSDVKKDNEIKVTDSLENEAKSDNKLKVTEPSKKEVAPPSVTQSRFNVFKSHLTSLISLTPMKPKEPEKTPNTSKIDSPAKSASSITTGDLSQHKESEEANSNSKSSRNQQEKNATQSSSETENAHEVHSQKKATTRKDDDNAHEVHSQKQATTGKDDDNAHEVHSQKQSTAGKDDDDDAHEVHSLKQATSGKDVDNVYEVHSQKKSTAGKDDDNAHEVHSQKQGTSGKDVDNAHEVHSQKQATTGKDDGNAHEVHSQKQATTGKDGDNTRGIQSQEQETAKEDEPNWRQMFMDGLKDKEKLLLTEYTNILRNYKDMKKTLSELEKQNQEILFDTSLKLKELKSSNALKDEEIRLLRQKLGLMERSLEGLENLKELRAIEEPVKKEEEDDDDDYGMGMLKVYQRPETTSAVEERFRRGIDEILEENLGFWLKFSATFTEIQRFETTIKDLQSDVSKLEESGKSESVRRSLKSEARPIYKHLTEIYTELSVWLDKGASLREELQHRSASLCEIQEEITKALKASAEDYDFTFTSFQAAKFQGEVLNMKQENNKVADELQAGLDHVSGLQSEIEKVLVKMGEQYGFESSKKPRNTEIRPSDSSDNNNNSNSNSNNNNNNSNNRGNRSQVPLGAFIFGVKPKKQKHSIFSGISPGMHKKYRAAMKGQYL